MTTFNIHAAKTQLSDLIARVEAGEEIVIARANRPVAKLIAIDPPKLVRQLGQNLGGIRWVAPDFDAPLAEDFLLAPEATAPRSRGSKDASRAPAADQPAAKHAAQKRARYSASGRKR